MSKIAPVFDRVVGRGDEMTYEEVVVAFTIAPLLGRWRATRELGDKVSHISDMQVLLDLDETSYRCSCRVQYISTHVIDVALFPRVRISIGQQWHALTARIIKCCTTWQRMSLSAGMCLRSH